jgi:hypothetical protein
MQRVVPSASNLIIFLEPESTGHKWKDITADGMIMNHNPKGDSREARMEQIALHIQKFDMREVERCYVIQGKN